MAEKVFAEKAAAHVAPATEGTVAKKDDAAFKAAKKEAAKRFAEKKAAEKKATLENSKKLIELLKKDGSYEKLPEDLKSFLEGLANPQRAAGNGIQGIFKLMFGDNPKVGDKITLRDVFDRTLKGKAEIDAKIKVWAEKGTIVEYTANANPVLSTYEIKKLAL